MSAHPTSIVIVGAGFAGTTLVRAMAKRLPPGVSITLVSDESYTTFNPMLPEAVGASVFPEQVVVPVREMLPPAPGHRFIMGSVTQVDTQATVLHCRTLAGDLSLPYAHLVLAFGNRARLDLLPGMADHALPLKTVGDAMHIRNTVLRRLARIELESDSVLRRELGHFIVIGGGFSGVEVAGELVDCLHSIRRYYPQVRPDELQVTVLHGTERLLPELSPRLGEAALRSLLQRGVAVHLQTRAASVSDGCVLLLPAPGQAKGAVLKGQTLICTIGTEANPLACKLGLPMSGGRIVVAPDLSVPQHPGVWALGDCAAVPNALDGKVSPPTAQYAVRQARHLADNLLASLAQQTTQPFSYQCRGMMASIGHLKGVAEVGGVPLTGWLAWLVWRGYYLSQMPSFGRKLRIFWEWTWGMFFPPDITHLRFTRSHELRMDEQRRQAEEATQTDDPMTRHG